MATWAKKWKIKINSNKSKHVIFTTRYVSTPEVKLNTATINTKDCVKYLGMHLDKRLTWKHHLTAKRKQVHFKMKKLY